MAKQNSKSNFISYVAQSVGLDSKRQSTFKSYIDNGDADADKSEDYNVTVEESASEFFDMELQPGLLPGESLISEADSVLKFTPYSDGKQGTAGKLCATNFKLSFVTADRSSYELPGRRQRNKLLDENDIPLTSIDAIYQVTTNGSRKKLQQGKTTTHSTKLLEIHCKDFRVHTFSFKFTPKSQNKKFTNVVVHHAFVAKDNFLFAYEYGRNNPAGVQQYICDTPMFDSIFDWDEELRRCKADKKWRVTDVNLKYDMSQSLPQYFVVPAALLNSDLTKAAPQFNLRRIPTWCHTHINGMSLVRMTPIDENSDQQNLSKKMMDAIKVCGTGRQQNTPTIMDLTQLCPTCKEVQDAYYKLKKLCVSDTVRDFLLQDMNWYSSVDDTKWLQLVARCLSVSSDVANSIINSNRTVVIKEENGCDFSPLICSIVEILLDPYFRTQLGFQSLIQKEWVRMGHPFQKYLTLVTESETEQPTPIFLLFLDCVWQLLQQFPSCFEYTETYLTTLWDTSHIGIFDTFLFDYDHQRHNFLHDKKNIKTYKLPSAWKWDLQFSTEDLSFFKDPLYVLTHNQELESSIKDLKQLSKPGTRSQRLRNNTYSRELLQACLDNNSKGDNNHELCPDVLTPEFSAPVIRIWSQCYFRWQAPAQILSGGQPSQYLQQCHMVEEIIQLQHKAELLQQRTDSRTFRPRSDLIFGQATNSAHLTDLLSSSYLTSSFPFSPGPTTKDQQMMSCTPTLSMYMRNSSLDFDKYVDED